MRVRDFEPRDLAALRRIFEAQQFEYDFPEDPSIFTSIRVLVDETDTPVMALAARPTVEMFMFMDPTWRTPGWRSAAFTTLHEDMRQQLIQRGYTDVHAWLPPEIAKSFGRRLMRTFGWVKQLWPSYSRKL